MPEEHFSFMRYTLKRLFNAGKIAFSRFSIYNGTAAVLVSVAGVYQLHRLSKGSVLSSRGLTCISFFFLFFVFTRSMWPWMRLKKPKPIDRKWLLISFLSLIVVVCVWAKKEGFRGDYRRHKQYVLQLQNGFEGAHFCYKDAPSGLYPPITPTVVATISNLSRLSAHHSYLFFLIFLSFFMPKAAYEFCRGLGFTALSAFFFSCLVTLYGGFIGKLILRLPHLYLPALQDFLPSFPSRFLSLFAFIIFLKFWFEDYRTDQVSYAMTLSLGVIAGIMVLIHTQTFMVAMALLSVTLIRRLCARKSSRWHFLSLAVAFVISILYFGPAIAVVRYFGGFVSVPAMPESYPDSLQSFCRLFGLLPPLAVVSLWRRKSWQPWVVFCLLTPAALIAFRALLSIAYPGREVFVFRINRFGPVIFICMALLASGGLARLIRTKAKLVGIVLMCLVLFIGYCQIFPYLYRYNRMEIFKEFKISSLYSFPDGVEAAERVRFLVSDPRKPVMVPAQIAQLFTYQSGLDVPYFPDAKIRLRLFYKKTITQEERYKRVETFYKALGQNILRDDILSFFGAGSFLAEQTDLDKKFEVAKLGSIELGMQQKKEWFLYEAIR